MVAVPQEMETVPTAKGAHTAGALCRPRNLWLLTGPVLPSFIPNLWDINLRFCFHLLREQFSHNLALLRMPLRGSQLNNRYNNVRRDDARSCGGSGEHAHVVLALLQDHTPSEDLPVSQCDEVMTVVCLTSYRVGPRLRE